MRVTAAIANLLKNHRQQLEEKALEIKRIPPLCCHKRPDNVKTVDVVSKGFFVPIQNRTHGIIELYWYQHLEST